MRTRVFVLLIAWLALGGHLALAGDWPQMQGDARHRGDAPHEVLEGEIGIIAAIPLTDAIQASPVISDGLVHVVDGSGVVFTLDEKTLDVVWRYATKGGAGNVNNVSTPAAGDGRLYVGTTSGYFYVFDAESGAAALELDCGEPIFSAIASGDHRVYFATLGARIYAIDHEHHNVWTWDFVKEVIGFEGNRWSGADWLAFRGNRVTWRDHFVCSRDICLLDDTVVMPAGGRTIFVRDAGDRAEVRAVAEIPSHFGAEFPATFGQSADQAGNVYVQWHRRDNAGRVEMINLDGDSVKTEFVQGTETNIRTEGLLSFAPMSTRSGDVYRVRPEWGKGLMRHRKGLDQPELLCEAPGISPPILTRDHVVYGGLDGNVHVVPLSGAEAASVRIGAPITAPLAIANGRIYVPSEDGHLYVLGAGGNLKSAAEDLEVWKIRSPLEGKLARSRYDWYTNYGNFAGTNSNDQDLAPPLRMRWVRRVEGTVKHLPVCGGGRMYTHTAEGQIIAVEQDTGRLLWRRYWPDIYLSFTSPLYIDGKLLVPQAGMKRSMMRCLDAATGQLLWEAPFTGSPGWSRQFPPVVHDGIAVYASGSGEYLAQGSEKYFIFSGEPQPRGDGREVMSWIYSNDNPYYPKNHRPRLWAWDLQTGKLVWEKDLSDLGRGGNDCGICIYDGKLYYSVFFGYAASKRKLRGLPGEHNGLTACLDPKSGEVIWMTHDYFVTSKCMLSARDGRIFLGGHNRAHEGTSDRFVWCLDAEDGSLVWASDGVTSALNVVSVGERFVFCSALRGKANVFDRDTGKVIDAIGHNYACCRFTLSEPYVLGANMDMMDLSQGGKLVSTGPAIDSRECLGAVVSNGRVFYTSQASGLAASMTYGATSDDLPAAWDRR